MFPLYKDNYKLYMSKPKQSVSWTTFSDIFHPHFWIAIATIGAGLIAGIFFNFHFSKVNILLSS